MFSFVGLCIKKTASTFTLQNYHGPEFVRFNFPINAPNIIHVEVLPQYNFSTRLSKLYYYKKTKIISPFLKFSKNKKTRVNPLLFLYKSGFLTTKEKKKLRFKFRL